MNGKRNRTRAPASADGLPHLAIEQIAPLVDHGRFPAKRLIGAAVEISAAIFKDGHDQLAARVRYKGPHDSGWRSSALTYDFASDRWSGRFIVDRLGRWQYAVEGWTDVFGTWRSGLEKKVAAGQDVHVELLEGAQLLEATGRRLPFGPTRNLLRGLAERLRDSAVPQAERAAAVLVPDVASAMASHWLPNDLTASGEFPIQVDRPRAGFANWYELFPRSATPHPGRHGTFADAEQQLPRLAELGFDVVYLPPIHPIGHTFRKGRNNTLTPQPDDVGSPWAIGSHEGGHTAVDPQLGTLADFERFVARAAELGMEVALDYALQCSPDHPWVREHPHWFHIRPDGTIQYAENPPKKYQDIYPLNFWCADREGLWNACRDIVLFWAERGVRTFRVDNPHTKPFAFWEWMIGEVQARYPDTVFLAEAFTRPNKLLYLARLGFTQSYTYFTWKNTADELREFLTEFSRPEVLEFHRGNFFANTPDILHEYLQRGGRPAFRVRLLLAGTLSPLYGIYSGFELAENVPVRQGSEEYLNSEKYELRPRDFEADGHLGADLLRLNRIRCAQPALQRADNLRFHGSANPHVLCFTKRALAEAPYGVPHATTSGDDLLIVANLDPLAAQESTVEVPLELLGLAADRPYVMEDLLTGARYTWRGHWNYVRLDPALEPAHVFRVVRT
ncbi:MAG TPA: alpha-1,4-glucan--maltose-1-phosphate maltosyltransferase [Gemmatimonadaceae bacterium]|nr:alpha-1,4-glucan--maltose-1-phosphate maltosyltransferase [Gemmatimonadaceae bacterium]